MPNYNQPMAEVFGYPIDNVTQDAVDARTNKLCPFKGAGVPCTKDRINAPLGVCSAYHPVGGIQPAITCPSRFLEGGVMFRTVAEHYFGTGLTPGNDWFAVREQTLVNDAFESAGDIDWVVVRLDGDEIVDYVPLEVQAVYNFGNTRRPFEAFMRSPTTGASFTWPKNSDYPHPDFTSSTRKRLAPQLVRKGTILHGWKRKIAVAVDAPLFDTIRNSLAAAAVSADQSELAWFIFDLVHDPADNAYRLEHAETVHTRFDLAMEAIAKIEAGSEATFLASLKARYRDQAFPKKIRARKAT